MIEFYKEVLDAFVAKGIRFVLIGGYAVNAYGFQRTTGDMDLLLDSSSENIDRVCRCLFELGFDEGKARKALAESSGMLFLKEDPYRVDLLTKLNLPHSFDEVYNRAELRSLFSIDIKVIGYSDLIDEKARSKRDKDLLDIAKLEEIRRAKNH